MSIYNKYAFVDECGNTSLDTETTGTSRYYILTAIIVPGADLDQMRAQTERVRQGHFQTGEMKSNKVGNDVDRRLDIIRDISRIPGMALIIAVDKSRLPKDSGLRFKRSFIKAMYRILYTQVFRTFPNAHIVADKIGTPEFMTGFEKYVRARSIPDFFSGASLEFIDSRNEVLVQLADFLAGTIYKAVDEQSSRLSLRECVEALGEMKTVIRFIPLGGVTRSSIEYTRVEEKWDTVIADSAINSAQAFFELHRDYAEPIVGEQIACLEYLVQQIDEGSPERYVTAREIWDHVSPDEFPEQHFRSNIIAELREAQVLIASSEKGYKLATCLQDCHDFVRKTGSTVEPLLHRLSLFSETVRLATGGQVNLLEADEYGLLRKVIQQ